MCTTPEKADIFLSELCTARLHTCSYLRPLLPPMCSFMFCKIIYIVVSVWVRNPQIVLHSIKERQQKEVAFLHDTNIDVSEHMWVWTTTHLKACVRLRVCVCAPPTSVYFFHHINSFCHQRRSIISPCLLLTAISSSITQSKLRLFKKKKKKRFSDTNKYQFYHQIRHLFGTADIKSDDSFQKGWTFILPATREANQSLLLLI